MIKIAIIGASALQLPLILKAKARGLQTHVFAWGTHDVGETAADFFYPISIIEKDLILAKCREIGIAGICSIASDLAMITVNFVAAHLGLVGNSLPCTLVSTNKHEMRRRFLEKGDPSPRFIIADSTTDFEKFDLSFPVIVKPVDRSGSRGVTKVDSVNGLQQAVRCAFSAGFEQSAMVEEFVDGEEFSVETMSWQGQHEVIAITKKFTTGAPRFIEVGHLEPALIDSRLRESIVQVTLHALTTLEIQYGASHTELKIANDGAITLIEIGGRMGGDFIGSDLVNLSTGIDFVNAVLDVALGIRPSCVAKFHRAAAIRYIFSREDLEIVRTILTVAPELIVRSDIQDIDDREIADSSSRYGYVLFAADTAEQLLPFLPQST